MENLHRRNVRPPDQRQHWPPISVLDSVVDGFVSQPLTDTSVALAADFVLTPLIRRVLRVAEAQHLRVDALGIANDDDGVTLVVTLATIRDAALFRLFWHDDA